MDLQSFAPIASAESSQGLVRLGEGAQFSEGPVQGSASSWVDNYVASYRYGGTWAVAIFPIFAPFAIYLVRESPMAIAVAIAAEVLMLLVFFEWRTPRDSH